MKKLLFIICTALISIPAFADSAGVKAAKEICNLGYYQSDKEACYLAIKDKDFGLAAVNICAEGYYFSDKQACLVKIADFYHDDQAVNICKLGYYHSDKVDCLQKVSNLSFDSSDIELCSGGYYFSDKVACLQKMGTPYSGETGLAVIRKLKRTRRAIKNENYEQATTILNRMIRGLKENGSSYCEAE